MNTRDESKTMNEPITNVPEIHAKLRELEGKQVRFRRCRIDGADISVVGVLTHQAMSLSALQSWDHDDHLKCCWMVGLDNGTYAIFETGHIRWVVEDLGNSAWVVVL